MRPLNVAPNGSINFVLFYSQSYSGLVCLLAEFLLVKSYVCYFFNKVEGFLF